jgi:hypothetical protein
MKALRSFFGKLLLTAAAVHLVVSACLAIAASRSFEMRMPNLRLVDREPELKQGLIASYLRDAVDDGRPVTCFIGSSFTWGYPMVENAALAASAGEAITDSRTINASIIGAGLEVARNTLLIARERNLRFARVVIEIPIVNELDCLEAGSSWASFCLPARSEPFVRVDRYPGSYFGCMLTMPAAWRRVPELILDTGSDGEDGPVQLGKLPGTYFMNRARFAAVREAYVRSITATLDAAFAVADEVVAFPSPIYVSGAETLGFDRWALEEQVAVTLQACRSVTGVTVVEPEPRHLTDAGLFANVTHFNRRGNREFGEWIAGKIVAGDRGDALAASGRSKRR